MSFIPETLLRLNQNLSESFQKLVIHVINSFDSILVLIHQRILNLHEVSDSLATIDLITTFADFYFSNNHKCPLPTPTTAPHKFQ